MSHDPTEGRLTPVEWVLARPHIFGPLLASGLAALLDFTVITSHWTPVHGAVAVLTIILWSVAGTWLTVGLLMLAFEDGWDRDPRIRRIKSGRPTRYRRNRIVAVPDGEYVDLRFYRRGYELPRQARFHALHEDDKAHARVAEWREEATRPEGPRPEAAALARVLNRSAAR